MANQEEMHVQEEEFVEYDPEVQIYPGGPTQGEVETWKAGSERFCYRVR